MAASLHLQRRARIRKALCVAVVKRYGAGPHRAPWCTRIHQVPDGKSTVRLPAVQAAKARSYCALKARSRLTASVAAPRCPAAAN